jgi:hypothetical protein
LHHSKAAKAVWSYARSLLREWPMWHLLRNLGFIGSNKRYKKLRWKRLFYCTWRQRKVQYMSGTTPMLYLCWTFVFSMKEWWGWHIHEKEDALNLSLLNLHMIQENHNQVWNHRASLITATVGKSNSSLGVMPMHTTYYGGAPAPILEQRASWNIWWIWTSVLLITVTSLPLWFAIARRLLTWH